jgi:hypothetical protein
MNEDGKLVLENRNMNLKMQPTTTMVAAAAPPKLEPPPFLEDGDEDRPPPPRQFLVEEEEGVEDRGKAEDWAAEVEGAEEEDEVMAEVFSFFFVGLFF